MRGSQNRSESSSLWARAIGLFVLFLGASWSFRINPALADSPFRLRVDVKSNQGNSAFVLRLNEETEATKMISINADTLGRLFYTLEIQSPSPDSFDLKLSCSSHAPYTYSVYALQPGVPFYNGNWSPLVERVNCKSATVLTILETFFLNTGQNNKATLALVARPYKANQPELTQGFVLHPSPGEYSGFLPLSKLTLASLNQSCELGGDAGEASVDPMNTVDIGVIFKDGAGNCSFKENGSFYISSPNDLFALRYSRRLTISSTYDQYELAVPRLILDPLIQGDSNSDGKVELKDFSAFKQDFNKPTSCFREYTSLAEPCADFNADGQVNIQDFGLLKGGFGYQNPHCALMFYSDDPGNAISNEYFANTEYPRCER